MRTFHFELKKLLRLPMLWGFLALSLALNGLLTMMGIQNASWYTYVASALPVTFQRTDAPAFAAGLELLPDDALRAALAEQTEEPVNALDGYDAALLGAQEAGLIGVTGKWADIFAQKYAKLQPVVDEMAASGVAYDVYAAAGTKTYHTHLTGIVYHAALTEALLLAVLLTLYAFGYEAQHNADLLVFSTRAGRGVNRAKLAAALTASLLCYVFLCVCSLLLFAAVYHLRDFLRMNVSSSFHYVVVAPVLVKPFLTWKPFTLAGYLGATLALGAALTAVFALYAAVCGLLLRNTWLAFLAWFVTAMGMLALPIFAMDSKAWTGYFLGMCLPVPVWLNQQYWFTELGGAAFLPWQETICTIGSLAAFALLTLLAMRHFWRKDLT